MHFQYPQFLLALALLAVPVIIHLFDFRRAKKMYFPSLRFLKNVEQRSASARKLRDRLILASRLLALAFLILAFAKPYLAAENAGKKGTGRIVSVYVDNSRSMEAVGPNGRLLDEARTRARQLAEAYHVADRFQLLTADFEGRHQRLVSREEFITGLDEIKISPLSRSLPDIQKRQLALFKQDNGAAKTAWIISDFQQNMRGSLAPDPCVQYKLMPLRANPLANISVDSAWFASPVHQPGQAEQLVVRLRNNSGSASPSVPVKLYINKQQKALAGIALKARESKTDTLRFSGLRAGWQQGQVYIGDYPVTFDDTLNLAFRVRENLPVLNLYEQKPNPFVKAAFSTDAFFAAEDQPAGQVDYGRLNNFGLVVLSDATSVSAGLAQQLKTYMQAGGTVVFSPSAEARPADLDLFLGQLGAGPFLSLKKQPLRVASIRTADALFNEVFESVPRNMDMPRVNSFFETGTQARSNSRVLMTMDGRRPMLLRYPQGKGRFYLFTVPLTDSASNLPRHALFVPLFYRMAMLGLRDGPLFYTLGSEQPVITDAGKAGEKEPLRLVMNNTRTIPDVRPHDGGWALYTADQLNRPGLYRLQQGTNNLALLAFNADRKESDLSYMDNDEIRNSGGKNSIGLFNSGNAPPEKQVAAGTDAGRELWKVCLLLALVFLTAEMLLIRFMQISRPIMQNPTR